MGPVREACRLLLQWSCHSFANPFNKSYLISFVKWNCIDKHDKIDRFAFGLLKIRLEIRKDLFKDLGFLRVEAHRRVYNDDSGVARLG